MSQLSVACCLLILYTRRTAAHLDPGLNSRTRAAIYTNGLAVAVAPPRSVIALTKRNTNLKKNPSSPDSFNYACSVDQGPVMNTRSHKKYCRQKTKSHFVSLGRYSVPAIANTASRSSAMLLVKLLLLLRPRPTEHFHSAVCPRSLSLSLV